MPFDLVDENDRVVAVGNNDDARRLGLRRRAVHVFLLDTSGRLLLSRRPPDITFGGTFHSSAGGRVEIGEDYATAARRELLEELGIKTNLLRDCGRFELTLRGVTTINALFETTYDGQTKPDHDELEAVAYTTIPALTQDIKKNPEAYSIPFRAALHHWLNITETD